MRKEEFYYDSRDGKTKLHAVRYLPEEGTEVRMVLQIVHGMAEYVERYKEFAEFLTDQGIVVTGEDHMGHGRSMGRSKKLGYFCEKDAATILVRDIHRLKKATQALFPNVPYVILGHSMGSFIVRNYLFRYGTGVNAAVILGTGMQSMGKVRASKLVAGIQDICFGPEHVAKSLNKLVFGNYNQRIEQPKTANDWLTRDEEKVAEYEADPLCGFVFTVNGFATMMELLARLNVQENLARIPKKLPIYMASGTEDPVGEYGKGVERAYQSMMDCGIENITLKMYPGARHELLNEINRDEVMQDILNWLNMLFPEPEEEE